MPEGHTIHRLARDHRMLVVGRKVEVASPQGRFATGAELLTGRTVDRIEPYGKHLWYGFSGGLLLHIHLGLYGKWMTGGGLPPAVRGALRLRVTTDEAWLDLRGPTACEVVTPPERDLVVARLGPDPLRSDGKAAKAFARVGRSKVQIGQLLMDQSVLAGVGNVYRAEVLYRAGLSPFRIGRDVTGEEWERMWADLVTLMRAGVRSGRIVTTMRSDRARTSGTPTPADAHYVYRRHGEPCRRCGTEIRTQPMAARNLFWCPACQPS